MAGSPNQCPRHPNARLPQAIGGWQLRLICTANAQRAAPTTNSPILVNASSGWRYISAKTIRVRGVVIRKEKGPYIEVNDPSQIELVK